jgi:hypothetical protein
MRSKRRESFFSSCDIWLEPATTTYSFEWLDWNIKGVLYQILIYEACKQLLTSFSIVCNLSYVGASTSNFHFRYNSSGPFFFYISPLRTGKWFIYPSVFLSLHQRSAHYTFSWKCSLFRTWITISLIFGAELQNRVHQFLIFRYPIIQFRFGG